MFYVCRIAYQPYFKVKAVQDYKTGKGPSQIFLEHGFNLEVIGKEQPKRCLRRWRDTFEKFGEAGFESDRRGKGNAAVPLPKRYLPKKNF